MCYLLKTRLFEIRESWVWYLIMVCITPLSFIITLGIYFKGTDTRLLEFIVSGNMVMGMVTGSMLTLGQNLGFEKEYKGFDYYATLPISKSAIIISYVISSTILTLPSTIIIYIIGNILFGLNFQVSIVIVPVIFLGGSRYLE